jgi:hypothetical protein
VDKLVKVWRKNGRAVWVQIHVEVQVQRERGFARRLYVYNYRLHDRYNRTVVSLAVLADDEPNWRPGGTREELWGWSLRMTFPAVKLLDYAGREEELEADRNPFARVVLAHLKALETRRDPAARRSWKFRLVRGLYEQGLGAEDVRRLFRLIDWLLELPPVLDQLFWQELKSYQEERTVPFITTPERFGIRAGLMQAIEDALRIKFGEEGVSLVAEIAALQDAEKYRVINQAIIKATTLDEVRRACSQAAAPPPPERRSGANARRLDRSVGSPGAMRSP